MKCLELTTSSEVSDTSDAPVRRNRPQKRKKIEAGKTSNDGSASRVNGVPFATAIVSVLVAVAL